MTVEEFELLRKEASSNRPLHLTLTRRGAAYVTPTWKSPRTHQERRAGSTSPRPICPRPSSSSRSCSAGPPPTWARRPATTRCSTRAVKTVAAAGPKMPGDPSPRRGPPTSPSPTPTRRSPAPRPLGGSVLVEPMDVFDAGRMAILADPSGGVFAIWQPGTTIGPQLVNEPNSLCWNELTVRDPDAVLPFYSRAVRLDGGQARGPVPVPRAAPRRQADRRVHAR